jgi:hypothetical protein
LPIHPLAQRIDHAALALDLTLGQCEPAPDVYEVRDGGSELALEVSD